MKKLCAALVFVICILSVNFCSATDVWVTTEIDNDNVCYKTEYYLVTNYIDTKDEMRMHRFDIILKRVFFFTDGNQSMTTRPFEFICVGEEDNGKYDWYVTQTNSTIWWCLVKEDPIFSKILKACEPYVELARKYPIN